MIRHVQYFEKPGKDNTDACIALTREMVEKEDFEHVVLASTTGDSAQRMVHALEGFDVNVVAVTHSAGFKEINIQEFDPKLRTSLESQGVRILTATILTHSLETALSAKFQGVFPTQVIAHALRRWGEGSNVCCEIVMEAVDAGLIPEAEQVIALGGTGRGIDTVCVVRSAASKRFLDLFVSEVRAKPA